MQCRACRIVEECSVMSVRSILEESHFVSMCSGGVPCFECGVVEEPHVVNVVK